MTRAKTVAKIIEIKEFNKEQLEIEVKKARERLHVEQAKLDELDREYKKTSADLTGKQASGTMPATEVELFHTYLKHLARMLEQQKSVLAIHAAEVDKKQKAMVEAFQEQRLFELLHGRIIQEQARELTQGEQKEADFTFLYRKAER
jgi:flagellar export protein FliJ